MRKSAKDVEKRYAQRGAVIIYALSLEVVAPY